MESLTVSPKHEKLPYQKEELKVITGLEATNNSFKVVNIQESFDIN